MKLTSRKREAGKLELQMTSMIDCVFLLLIFFMVTSSFSASERQLDPGIKVQRSGAKSASDLAPTIIDVVRGSGGFVYKLGGRELTSAEELTDVLGQLDNKEAGAFVRASDDAPFSMATTAIQASRNTGYSLVTYVPMLSNP